MELLGFSTVIPEVHNEIDKDRKAERAREREKHSTFPLISLIPRYARGENNYEFAQFASPDDDGGGGGGQELGVGCRRVTEEK